MSAYIGRFAPSPTGPLHAGSLVSALASWLDARHHNGKWLLRIEDIDPQREIPGASEDIINCLRTHGLVWDGDIQYQSNRSRHYDQALQTLQTKQALFACECTRKQLRSIAAGNHSPVYPGLCRDKKLQEQGNALRVMIRDEEICFDDLVAGRHCENVARSTGDFIVRRRGPFYAYQLAVTVDDAMQGVTHVVRGADLLDNTARQIALQHLLDYSTPIYLHLPIVKSNDGRKLSKQTGATALNNNQVIENLQRAWQFLGQSDLANCSTAGDFLQKAVSQWQRQRIIKPEKCNLRPQHDT